MLKSHYTIVKSFVYNNKSEILILESKWGYWDLPGGHLEFEESPEEGLLREIKEETGINVIVERLHAIQTVILDRSHRQLPEMRHYSVLIFRCRLTDEKLQIKNQKDEDIINFRWLTSKQILEDSSMTILPCNKDLLQDIDKQIPILTKKNILLRREN